RGLCLPRECLRSDHCGDLSRDRRVAGAVAARAGKGRRTRTGAADVAVSVAELPGDRGDGAGADRDGADALAPRGSLDQHHFDRRHAARVRAFPTPARGARPVTTATTSEAPEVAVTSGFARERSSSRTYGSVIRTPTAASRLNA